MLVRTPPTPPPLANLGIRSIPAAVMYISGFQPEPSFHPFPADLDIFLSSPRSNSAISLHLSVHEPPPLSAFVKTTSVRVFASASVLNSHLSCSISFFSDEMSTTAPRSIFLALMYFHTASPQLAWLLNPYPGVSTKTRLYRGSFSPCFTWPFGIFGRGPTAKAFMSVVLPGRALTLAASILPTRALRKEDLPTLEAPRMRISGMCSFLGWWRRDSAE
ncbi:uncharacterized protein TrAtP1_002852 [Trichoderma atroviride]|uniref:uncharacterized protein n=1 Tax=Hypocrea atroviridis TaxID=63577 RepID=UPI00331E39FE|nr:hypothetical protein TrAtP1_002852 [Trichoderma atroviride]